VEAALYDLVTLTAETVARIEREAIDSKRAFSRTALADEILGDEPQGVADSLVRTFGTGAALDEIALAAALAASKRLGRFHSRNEFSDWDWAHHAVTEAAALRRMSRRTPTSALRPLLVQIAMYIFLARFLNVPKHVLPHERPEPRTGTIADIESAIELRRPDKWTAPFMPSSHGTIQPH
jgi:hypothetical protein